MHNDFIQIPHTADIKIRVFGATKKELVRNALIGMFQVVHPIAPGCRIVDERVVCDTLAQEREVVISAPNFPILLIDFLSEALYLSDVHNEAYLDATIAQLSDTHLSATIRGVVVQGFQVVELKAVTYHDLCVQEIGGRWQADIVFDI